MTKVKIIKGTPVYLYRGTQYLEKPEKCKIKSMMYNEEENITYVKCSKPNYIYEILCALVIIGCVIFNNFIYEKPVLDFQYNSVVQYYNESLYLNLTNPESNEYPLHVEIRDGENVVNSVSMQPGTSIITIGVEDVKDKYTLRVSCKYLFTEVYEDVTISVVRKD